MQKSKSGTGRRPRISTAKTIVMAIDVGGSHVKFKLNSSDQLYRDVSGSNLDASAMVETVMALVGNLKFDVISIGYPGPVSHDRIIAEPANLAKGWVGFDFSKAFGKPVRIVNDALMQAIGSYEGGRMLFLGLGTGLGSAMIVDHSALPLELAHLPFRKGKTYEDYVGELARKKNGKKKWRKDVARMIEQLRQAMVPDYIIIGGGSAGKIKCLPEDCRYGDNNNAFAGGFRIWDSRKLKL